MLLGALGGSEAFVGALGRSGASGAVWGALARSGALWGALGRSGALWGVLGRSGALWGSLDHSGGAAKRANLAFKNRFLLAPPCVAQLQRIPVNPLRAADLAAPKK